MIVIDTSVAIQWLVSEPDSELAEALLGRTDLAAPDLILVEAANVMRKKLRDGQIVADQAMQAPEFLRANIGQLVPFEEILRRAFALAVQMGHPVYDCMFLACAEKLNAVLVTRDGPLLQRATAAGYGYLFRLLDNVDFEG